MPDIEYNTFHPAAVKDNEEGTLLPPSLSGTTTSAGGEEEAETKIAAVLSPSKKIGFGILFVGLMTIVVTAISKNNAGNRTSVTELPMYGWADSCCVPATGTFSGSALNTFDDDSQNYDYNGYHYEDHTVEQKPDPFETCWQAYEGDLSDNKPLNQYCWTKSYYIGTWQACKPPGSWKFVTRASGDCSDPCREVDHAC